MKKFFACSLLVIAIFLGKSAPGLLADEIRDLPPGVDVPSFFGRPAEANPLPPKQIPDHPYLAPQPSMHVDIYNTGVVELPTPLGCDPIVQSASFGSFIGMCLNFFYDSENNLFAFCGEMPGGVLGGEIDFQLALLDPDSMTKRATFTLLTFTFLDLLQVPMEFGYMNLDHLGRLIVIDDNNQGLFVGIQDVQGETELAVLDSIDLSVFVDPTWQKIATLVPDYDGRYWFMTLGEVNADNETVKPALLGVYDPESGQGEVHEFTGENIGNGLALEPDGVYAITDYATYRFGPGALPGTMELHWREEYTRGATIKPGVLSWYGSGATPALMDDRFLVMTDNADEQINLLVYRRQVEFAGERLICSVPLFTPGNSANENSPIVHGNSILVQNWYNAPKMIIGNHRQMAAGLWRIDVREDESGCDVVWENTEISAPGTMKLSTETGLIYGAMMNKDIFDAKAWYAALVDFETGETVNKILLGTGMLKDILYIPVYFGPDGTFYQPVLNGYISIRDSCVADDGADDDTDDDLTPNEDDDNDEESSSSGDDDDAGSCCG
jgi:hypothetical protein